MNATYGALARFVVRFRWLVVVFWLLAAAVTGALLPSLGKQVNNNSAFLPSREPSSKAAALAGPLLGSGANRGVSDITIVAVIASGRLGPAAMSAILREE
ncbi:MAG: hypothetical protein M0T77_15220 [Actinomycetota bacterium]|nr:hypothetical protein [Actinomycetota bacterium]